MAFTIKPGKLTIENCRDLLIDHDSQIELAPEAYTKIDAAHAVIKNVIDSGEVIYGINTGFGSLANTHISENNLTALQEKIVLSHAAGTGEYVSDDIVRLIIILKVNSLARGFSGVKRETIDALMKLYNKKVYPCIPAKGSVGASGDLAPLAHLSAALLGAGEARYDGKLIPASKALKIAGLSPLKLSPKEGLALLNGTQASTSFAIMGLLATEQLLETGLITGAMSVDAACGSDKPFDSRIHNVRGHAGQIKVAEILRDLLDSSSIRKSHLACNKVQDPYSLRCQPQVMGACLTQLWQARDTLITEANAVSDNPLVFAEQNEIISGGNFHAEPVGFAADGLALSIAEIGSISERRIALLTDSHFSGLPAFLVNKPGLNSGFMIAQCTAAALASENKSHAHPAVVDSMPTSANQEDHVSMATYAARRLQEMADNTAGILAIELLAACQGLDFHKPLQSSEKLEAVHKLVREHVSFYAEDRFFAPDIQVIKDLIQSGKLRQHVSLNLL